MTKKPLVPLYTVAQPLSDHDIAQQTNNLKDLQGHILKGHGRDHAAFIFLKFAAGKVDEARKWLGQSLKKRITNAHDQLEAAQAFRKTGQDAGVFHAFMLSAAGYRYFGKDVAVLDALDALNDPSFRAGSKASIVDLHDPVVDEWDEAFRDEIHALVLIADIRQANVRFLAKEFAQEVEAFATVVGTEFGDQQKNARGDGMEHFGYVDGRSQPLMLERDAAGESDGMTLWNPMTGPSQVLVRDPFGGPESSGSYFVFRKLEEKVKQFKVQEQVLATALGLQGDARELAGALVIGRFEDGTPVTLSNTPMIEDSVAPNGGAVPNNFDYDTDAKGARCPFHSHIRKSNPRGSGPGGVDGERPHHMARRGITYGDRKPDTFENIADMPDGEDGTQVGLLFMSYQASIVNQFEFIQKAWVNDPGFPSGGVGLDPVIGQADTPAPAPQQWTKEWGNATSPKVSFDFRDFVVMRGGEYFFAPSLSGIAGI